MAHHLPVEILTQIFEISARSSQASARRLSSVASWVRTLALPYLWSTFVVDFNTATEGGIGPFVLQVKEEESIDICGSSASPNQDAVLTLPNPLWGNSGSGTSEPTTTNVPGLSYVRNLFLVPLKEWRTENVVESIPRFATHITSTLFPRVQRLAISPHDLEQIKDNHPYCQLPKLKELSILSYAKERVTLFHNINGRTLQFSGLTHLRLGNISFRVELSLYELIGKEMPSLTHFACEYDQIHIYKFLEDGDDIFRLPAIQLLQQTTIGAPWPPPESRYSKNPYRHNRLRYVLMFLREPPPNQAWAGLSRAMARAWKAFQSATLTEERLLCMRLPLGYDFEDDWKVWAKLAREARNIWDEAIELREQRRREVAQSQS